MEFGADEKVDRLYFFDQSALGHGLEALCVNNCKILVFQCIHYCKPGQLASTWNHYWLFHYFFFAFNILQSQYN